MRADELNRRYRMAEHPENGTFLELDFGEAGEGRAVSGAIYYYVAPGEHTGFHRIDCGEYWCYCAGEPLEVWIIGEQGGVSVKRLGTDEGCDPLIYFKPGEIFASRARKTARDGTFMACVTAPHFEYGGFELFNDAAIRESYPRTAPFFEDWTE